MKEGTKKEKETHTIFISKPNPLAATVWNTLRSHQCQHLNTFYQTKKGICDNYSEEKQHLLHQLTTKSIKHQVKSEVIELADGNSGDGFHW